MQRFEGHLPRAGASALDEGDDAREAGDLLAGEPVAACDDDRIREDERRRRCCRRRPSRPRPMAPGGGARGSGDPGRDQERPASPGCRPRGRQRAPPGCRASRGCGSRAAAWSIVARAVMPPATGASMSRGAVSATPRGLGRWTRPVGTSLARLGVYVCMGGSGKLRPPQLELDVTARTGSGRGRGTRGGAAPCSPMRPWALGARPGQGRHLQGRASPKVHRTACGRVAITSPRGRAGRHRFNPGRAA